MDGDESRTEKAGTVSTRPQAPPNYRDGLWRHKGNGRLYRVTKLVYTEVFSVCDYDWIVAVQYHSVEDVTAFTKYVRSEERFLELYEWVPPKRS